MAMGFNNLSPAQLSAAQQIYGGFNQYALNQGATPTEASQFAQMGLGVASGEGLMKANPWSSNPDASGTSVGPFQLYSGGLGQNLGGNTSPANQVNVAAAAMWNGPGTDGYYNTQPWNAVGDTPGTGGNDTVAGQTMAQNIGAQYVSSYPSISNGSGPVYDSSTPSTAQGSASGSMSFAGTSMDPSTYAPQSGAAASLPSMASGLPGTNIATPLATAATSLTSAGTPVPGTGMPVQDPQLNATTLQGDQAIGTAITNTGNSANKTAQSDTQSINQTNQADTSSMVGALAGIANGAFSNISNLFGRSILVLVGLVFLAGAVFVIGKQEGIA